MKDAIAAEADAIKVANAMASVGDVLKTNLGLKRAHISNVAIIISRILGASQEDSQTVAQEVVELLFRPTTP